MKNSSKSKLISHINKLLNIKNEKKLMSIKKKDYAKWDSLTHLQIIFLIEKNIKRKINISKLNKISSGKEIIKILNDN
tara:strand:- start:384 stop:617 length:234 start_codon:yes stop_codon:yes gene_type:complete